MMNKLRFLWLPALLVALALLSACQTGAPTGAAVSSASATPSTTPLAKPATEQPAASTGAFHDASVALAASAYPPPGTPIAEVPTTPPATGPDAAADNPYPVDTPIITDTDYVIPNLSVGDVKQVFKASTALNYPMLLAPNPARQPVFPDVPVTGRPALIAYEAPYEDGDYFEHRVGDMDIPEFNYRVVTNGETKIPQVGVHCIATRTRGCLVAVINHFGDTTMYRDVIADNGFTIAGRVWNMDSPDKVTMVGQSIIDHYTGRMTASPDGSNCSTIEACGEVEWHVVVIGNGYAMWHVTGVYKRSVESFDFNAPAPTDAALTPEPAVHLPPGQTGAQVLAPTNTPRAAAVKPAPTAPPVVLAEPTAAPAAPPAAEAAAPASKDFAAGESAAIPAGWSCSGDIKVDGTPMYDDSDATALIVHFTVGGTVFAEWGAHCEASPASVLAATITDGREVVVKEWGGK